MALSRSLAIFFVILVGLANISQAYDHLIIEDRFLARAFGPRIRRSLKQDSSTSNSGPKIVRVTDFGAQGNNTDSTQGFERAWNEACSSQGSVNFVVPSNIYIIKPITFKGPCKSDDIRVQIMGDIRAPAEISDYSNNGDNWILFDGVKHLTVENFPGGTLNGWGGVWWDRPCKLNNTQPCPQAPAGMTFNKCDNLVVTDLKMKNAQGVHFSINGCNNVDVSGVNVIAPANSPNTAGIIVRDTTNIAISDCVIGTGDDCIALNDGTRNARVSSITCGPGHGISIGSLGGEKSENHISDVAVDGVTLFETTNGLTIKTLPKSSGNISGVKFTNIVMDNVQNPILIDQEQNSAVRVVDVLYKNITGTSTSPMAIDFNCDKSSKCQGIVVQDINIRYNHDNNDDNARASCKNVNLTKIGDVSPFCPNNNNNVNNSPPTQTPPPADHHRVEQPSVGQNVVNVDDFGAKGNGRDDDSDAFNKALQEVCSSNEDTFLVVPQKSYLVKPIRLEGPCKSKITVQILGTMKAPGRSDFNSGSWISIEKVNYLTIEGGGTLDGNGEDWWRNSCERKSEPCSRDAPTALIFHDCQNLVVRDLTVKNSPQMQVIIASCENVKVHNLTISAPGSSPNTDGIHVTHSQNVDISNANIGTGDDCISISSGSSHISASDITCGPGHGISIGGLGKDAHVSNVTVTRSRFSGSTNGVRIKTWQGGSGTASNIKFIDIEMHNVRNPILIDQSYCGDRHDCPKQESAVQVRDVLYQNIRGTSATGVAIRLECSDTYKCENIVLQDINLRHRHRDHDQSQAICNNVHYTAIGDVSPPCPH